jgi:SAM-dependent methyltransferase
VVNQIKKMRLSVLKGRVFMGVDLFVFRFLMNVKTSQLGDALCLGRQGFHIRESSWQWKSAQQVLDNFDPGRQLESLLAIDGYSEKFLMFLGARSIVAMDKSPFEGAQIIHDLNKPVPSELKEKFDFILDGGTLEHVFNFPLAVENVKSMLRPGGLFVGINPANNQLGHGFYQFGPDLLWRVYSEDAGFKVEKMQLVPLSPTAEPIDLVDKPGMRQEIGGTPHSTYIMVAARKSLNRPTEASDVFQTDYEAAWNRHS